MSREPQIVVELRRENDRLRAEVARLQGDVARWQRQEEWVYAVAKKRVEALEAGVRRLSDRGYKKLSQRILNAPTDWTINATAAPPQEDQ